MISRILITLKMRRMIVSNIACGSKSLRSPSFRHYGRPSEPVYLHDQQLDEELQPSEWYRAAYAKLIKLTHVLHTVEQIDGRLTHSNDGSVVTDDRVINQMHEFTSLAKAFIGLPSMQSVLGSCFNKPCERNSMALSSLTKVCDFLGISAQQRKDVRLAICPQVTQHHIWREALEEVLHNLKSEMGTFNCHSTSFQMGEQIVLSCIEFFKHATALSNSESPSWMRPAPLNKVEKPVPSRTWEEVLEMFVDLSKCLEQEKILASHASKIEAMKEGLYQIRDILIERDISYNEVRRQDCLVQRKLAKSLGHSSKCLFTLLLYYLYGITSDIEVDVRGGLHMTEGKFILYIGKTLTSCEEKMILNGVKQMNRALGVFKFVWETAAMKGVLELQGHLWCVGAEERILTYRGNVFFVHGIRLSSGMRTINSI